MTKRTAAIILNGVGSVGKSSVARALQERSPLPLLHVSMDAFLDMLPPRLWDSDDGIRFVPQHDGMQRSVHVHAGETGRALLSGFRHSVAAMARQGNSLVVDDVMLGGEMTLYRQLLDGIETYVIGLFAPLDILEARERQRGDREIGLARAQFPLIRRGAGYDLEIDAAEMGSEQIARLICDRFNL